MDTKFLYLGFSPIAFKVCTIGFLYEQQRRLSGTSSCAPLTRYFYQARAETSPEVTKTDFSDGVSSDVEKDSTQLMSIFEEYLEMGGGDISQTPPETKPELRGCILGPDA